MPGNQSIVTHISREAGLAIRNYTISTQTQTLSGIHTVAKLSQVPSWDGYWQSFVVGTLIFALIVWGPRLWDWIGEKRG